MLIDFRQLFLRHNIKPKGVLHIGANRGEEADVYNELGIEKVIWIEGNPELEEKLKQNVNRFPGHVWMIKCISDIDGESQLHISNNGSQSSSLLELGTHKTAHPEVFFEKDIPVKTYRIDTLLKSENISGFDFLNIDLQGMELKALKGMGDLLHQFKWAYLEVNKEELYKGCALVNEIDDYISRFGFKRVETKWCGNTGWGDACYIKN